MPRREIKTFVFFDLEGTGLSDNPRITEITMLAMHRAAGEDMIYRARKALWAPGAAEGPPDLPRVINKLTICVYPMKPVVHEAAEITGLNNDNLYEQKDFDTEIGDLLANFLRRLEPPVCFVAHNGSRFDYPLLAAELQSTGCSPLILPNGDPVLCLDSWEMFRDLANDPVNYPNRYLREESPPRHTNGDAKPSTSDGSHGTPTASQERTPSSSDGVDITTFFGSKKRVAPEDDDGSGDNAGGSANHAASRARRELFPDDGKKEEVNSGSDTSLIEQVGDLKAGESDTTGTMCDETNATESAHSGNVSSGSGGGGSKHEVSTFQFQGFTRPGRRIIMTAAKRPSYKLVDLHQRIIGFEPPDSHRAEDDCITLARVFWLTPKAVEWADSHAVSFTRFRPLYIARRKPLPPGKFPAYC